MLGEHQSETGKRTRGKWWRLLLVVAILATAFSFAAVSHPSVAHAATNGQQISFACSTMSDGVVKGYNQNGNYVMWHGSLVQGTGYNYIFTNGWWWVGYARVYWWNPITSRWYSNQVYVPKQQNGDWSYFRCIY